MTNVYCIIPAYNEGPAIAKVVTDLHAALKSANFTFEIVVVDDGSKDDTASQAKSVGARVIKHILNTGTGGATATGLLFAQQSGAAIVATLDADGQHHPSDVVNGITLMTNHQADLLIGSRLINTKGMSGVKILGNKGLSFITFLLFGVRVTDSQSGLRIFSATALSRLRWKATGYEFCSEMLWRARQQHLSVAEYPVRAIYSSYSKGKGQNNWNAFNIVRSLIGQRIVELFE